MKIISKKTDRRKSHNEIWYGKDAVLQADGKLWCIRGGKSWAVPQKEQLGFTTTAWNNAKVAEQTYRSGSALALDSYG